MFVSVLISIDIIEVICIFIAVVIIDIVVVVVVIAGRATEKGSSGLYYASRRSIF